MKKNVKKITLVFHRAQGDNFEYLVLFHLKPKDMSSAIMYDKEKQ